MRDLHGANNYQQLLLSALALVHEADLVALLRAARKHPERNRAIDALNRQLNNGVRLWDAFAEPSPVHALFAEKLPEFRVRVPFPDHLELDIGLHSLPSQLVTISARMAGTGRVAELIGVVPYYPEGLPGVRWGWNLPIDLN